MYLKTKKQLLGLLDTFKEAIQYMKMYPETAGNYLEQCLQASEVIEAIVTGENAPLEEKFLLVWAGLQKILNEEQTAEEWDILLKDILCALRELNKAVTDLVPRLKIFFLPYKAEMWTALESIWQAFTKDPLCDTYVMPIPYHTLKFTQTGEIIKDRFCYEADKYPQEVPIVNYAQVDLALEQPDAVFIHNPYDEYNNLTRVPEQYYSRNLRSVTDMLVYSPYFTVSGFDPKTQSGLLLTAALKSAQKIVVQSEKLAKIYQSFGVNKEKLLVCGSPKMDSLVHGLDKPCCEPQEWQEKLKGKTVFLMNTNFGFFMVAKEGQQHRLGDVRDILKRVNDNESYALIWRPHPLLLPMIRSRGDMQLLEQLKQLLQDAEHMDRVVIDHCSSYLPSFIVSHAMLSTYSSLVTEYMVTGKPTCFLDIRFIKWGPHSNVEVCEHGPLPIKHNYFPSDFECFFQKFDTQASADWDQYMDAYRHAYGSFMEMVHNGEDPKRQERLKDIKLGFKNIDGTSGEAVYRSVKCILSNKGKG